MSNQYWRALNDEKADDSEYLKEYQSLSEKINDYFNDRQFYSDFSLTSSTTETHPKKIVTKKKNQSLSIPMNLEQRAKARMDINISNIPKIKPIKRTETVVQAEKKEDLIEQIQ